MNYCTTCKWAFPVFDGTLEWRDLAVCNQPNMTTKSEVDGNSLVLCKDCRTVPAFCVGGVLWEAIT